MAKKIVRVVGHKNPDTDSVCAAIAYANLKQQTDDTMDYVPMRAGSVSAETAFVLEYFKAETPELLKDVGTQIREYPYKKDRRCQQSYFHEESMGNDEDPQCSNTPGCK